MVRFVLTVPDRLKVAVLQQMLAWREEARPDTVAIRLTDKRDAQETTHDAAVPEIPAVPATPQPDRDRSTKVYRVIDTAPYVGPIPHMIRLYLIDNPNSTAKQVEVATGKGRKSVESALWLLRDRGVVKESVRA